MTESSSRPSFLKTWLIAALPIASTAAVLAVLLGLALSSYAGYPVRWGLFALTLVGVCLMLGLFTRLAALCGTGLLCMYYFAMPPWPGLPESPIAEGNYWIVDKNLIEAIALLMIATSGVGRWAGLDAYISAWRRRRRCAG